MMPFVHDPVNEVRNLSVDSWVAGPGAPNAPADNSQHGGLLTLGEKGAATVTLARVLAALGQTSTDHGVNGSISSSSVSVVTVLVRYNGNINLMKDIGESKCTLRQGSPSDDGLDIPVLLLILEVVELDSSGNNVHASGALSSTAMSSSEDPALVNDGAPAEVGGAQGADGSE